MKAKTSDTFIYICDIQFAYKHDNWTELMRDFRHTIISYDVGSYVRYDAGMSLLILELLGEN